MKGLQRMYYLFVDRLGITQAERSVVYILITVLLGIMLVDKSQLLFATEPQYDYSELQAAFESRFAQVKANQDALNARFYPHLHTTPQHAALAPGGSEKEQASAPANTTPLSININTADVKELVRLPGIGEKTAQLIIEHRITHGAFSHVKELEKVKGIGPKKRESLEPYIRLD